MPSHSEFSERQACSSFGGLGSGWLLAVLERENIFGLIVSNVCQSKHYKSEL